MIHYTDVKDAQKLFECLAAPARMDILKLVLAGEAESLDYLAKTLHLTNGAITQHVKKLCETGLIRLVETPGKHGSAKKCVPAIDRIIIDVASTLESETERFFDVPLGSFSSAQVKPYCAIACPDGWIGERDDPRFFTYPDRTKAALIYFNSGMISWTLPAPLGKHIASLSVSMELSSKPYGHGRTRPSATRFFINDVCLGEKEIDGEFTDRKGLFTPSGFEGICQYGKFKTVTVNGNGSFFDGIKIGSTKITDIVRDRLVFSISTENGLALFGKGYGDYDCGLKVKMEYER